MTSKLLGNRITLVIFDEYYYKGSDMVDGFAYYVGEELSVSFSAKGIWFAPENTTAFSQIEWLDVEIVCIQILGFEVDEKVLSDELVEAIRELADEVEFQQEWVTSDD